MSWQTPGKDPPPDPAAPEPDAETRAVPGPAAAARAGSEPPTERLSRRPTRHRPPGSSRRHRSAGPAGRHTGNPPPAEDPVVPWAPPVRPGRRPGRRTASSSPATSAASSPTSIDTLFLGLAQPRGARGLVGALGSDADRPWRSRSRPPSSSSTSSTSSVSGRAAWHATLGMRLLRLRVLNAATAGTLPLNDALLRWIAPERRHRDPRRSSRGIGGYDRADRRRLAPGPADHDRDGPAPPGPPRPLGPVRRRPAGARRLGRRPSSTCLVLVVLLFVVLPVGAGRSRRRRSSQDILSEIGSRCLTVGWPLMAKLEPTRRPVLRHAGRPARLVRRQPPDRATSSGSATTRRRAAVPASTGRRSSTKPCASAGSTAS